MTRVMITTLALTASAPALAGPHGHRGHHPVDPQAVVEHADEVLDAVDATDDQRSTITSILEEALPALSAHRDEAMALHEELHALFHAEQIDRAAVEVQRVELVDLFDRASATALGHLVSVLETFTVEQRQSLAELRQQRRARWQRRLGLGD